MSAADPYAVALEELARFAEQKAEIERKCGERGVSYALNRIANELHARAAKIHAVRPPIGVFR